MNFQQYIFFFVHFYCIYCSVIHTDLIFIYFQKELEECRRELEENYQQQLQKQREEIKKELFEHFEEKLKNIEELKTKLQNQIDDIRKMFYTCQSESTESHNQILTQEGQYVTTSVAPPETNNLESPEHEIRGTYENWGFSNSKTFHLIPISELKNMLNTLVHLDVTIKAQKDEGIALINQLRAASESLTVTMNSRFPPNGEFYYCGFWVNDLHDILDRIGNECVNVNYNKSKNVIFGKFMQIGNKEGWTEAYNCAGHHYLLDITTPQSRLDQYLWLLCCLVNIEKNYNVNEFEVYNVDTFEKEYDLTWREVE